MAPELPVLNPQLQITVSKNLGSKLDLSPELRERMQSYRPTEPYVKAWHYGTNRLFLFENLSMTAILVDTEKPAYVWSWQDPWGLWIPSSSEPRFIGNLICFGSAGFDGTNTDIRRQRIVALDATTGEPAWERAWKIDRHIVQDDSDLLPLGSRLVTWLEFGEFVSLDSATGKEETIDSDPEFYPRLVDPPSALFVGFLQHPPKLRDELAASKKRRINRIAAVDASTGRRKWIYEPDRPDGYRCVQVEAADGLLFFILCGDDHPYKPAQQFYYEYAAEGPDKLRGERLLVLRAQTGERVCDLTLRWHLCNKPYFSGTVVQAFGADTCDTSRPLLTIDPLSGKVSASSRMPAGSHVLPMGDMLLTGGTPRGLWAVDPKGGRGILWKMAGTAMIDNIDRRGRSLAMGDVARRAWLLDFDRPQPKKPKKLRL